MTLPIEEHPTWHIRDSSKLDDYISCPRQYFYAHILGWKLDLPAHDLYFGQCWHIAREFQLLNGYEDVAGAYEVFIIKYREVFGPETDDIYTPKDPLGAVNALIKFKEERSNDLIENEVVEINEKKMTEISGTVPVSDTQVLYYRMDSIMRRKSDGMIFSWDHKTTGEKYINGRQWAEAFYLSIQNGTYTHCLYCLFPIEQVLGIEFCGTGFAHLKRGSVNRPAGHHTTLQRVPAFKTPEQMNVWLWGVLDILNNIDIDMDRLMHCSDSHSVLSAFNLNPKSCTNYRGCPYHDFCLAWQNPLQRCSETPLGFKIEFWDPSKMGTTNKMNLEFNR